MRVHLHLSMQSCLYVCEYMCVWQVVFVCVRASVHVRMCTSMYMVSLWVCVHTVPPQLSCSLNIMVDFHVET